MSPPIWLIARVALGCGSGDGAPLPDAGPGADASDPDARTEDGPIFVGTWGRRGTAPGEFVEPSSVELDSEGFVIAAGHEDRIQKFTPDGELVAIWGTSGTGDGQFDHPHGLAVDRRRGDLVYIGDQENDRVQVFTAEGEFVRQWSDEQFTHIHDVGIDPSTGDIYVGDHDLDVLQRFTATGEPLAELGGSGAGPGEFDGVWGISTDSAGNVYVADRFNRRVQKLDRDGAFVTEWRGPTEPDGDFLKPTGVFVDAEDIVYVCDSLADAVLLFDTEGTFLRAWDLAAIVGSASEPEDIVIDPAGEHIYVADVLNHRIVHLSMR
jgi:DNA-binding beta-propeller fold protein YncE